MKHLIVKYFYSEVCIVCGLCVLSSMYCTAYRHVPTYKPAFLISCNLTCPLATAEECREYCACAERKRYRLGLIGAAEACARELGIGYKQSFVRSCNKTCKLTAEECREYCACAERRHYRLGITEASKACVRELEIDRRKEP